VPPSRTIINSWELLGNSGWNWKAFEPYYAKAYSIPGLQPELKDHLGIGWEIEERRGPIQTSYASKIQDPISKAWIETFKNLGLNMDQDPFSGLPIGAFASLSSIDPATKERSYAATAYYTPAAHRQNLHVLLNCDVQKILLERANYKFRASGVQYLSNGKLLTVSARREIILAAGSIQSPKVLEFSGIGDATLLQAHGIEVNIDNPFVGENLQDHFVCGIGFEAQDHVPTLDDLVRQDPKAIEGAMGEYFTAKSGPMTSVGVASYGYLPMIETLLENGKINLNEWLDGDEPNDIMAPLTKVYRELVRNNLVSKDEASGAFLAVAAQSVVPSDPGKTSLGKVLARFLDANTFHVHEGTTNQPLLCRLRRLSKRPSPRGNSSHSAQCFPSHSPEAVYTAHPPIPIQNRSSIPNFCHILLI
jgi:choline dehydrogenase-like flavoprotein